MKEPHAVEKPQTGPVTVVVIAYNDA